MNNNDKTRRSNMRYFLACRTNMTSTLMLLKRVICYTKLVFSLKWLGLSAGGISRLNRVAHISKNIRIRENGLILQDTPQWDLLLGTLKRTNFQNVMVLYLTEIYAEPQHKLLFRLVREGGGGGWALLWFCLCMYQSIYPLENSKLFYAVLGLKWSRPHC